MVKTSWGIGRRVLDDRKWNLSFFGHGWQIFMPVYRCLVFPLFQFLQYMLKTSKGYTTSHCCAFFWMVTPSCLMMLYDPLAVQKLSLFTYIVISWICFGDKDPKGYISHFREKECPVNMAILGVHRYFVVYRKTRSSSSQHCCISGRSLMSCWFPAETGTAFLLEVGFQFGVIPLAAC